jgi:hypothetical protein
MALRSIPPQSLASSISDGTYFTYLNQKPWMTGIIRTELKAAPFKEWDTNPDTYKKSHNAL